MKANLINYLSLFSGIGAFEKAMNRLNIDVNLVGYCEFDKFASKAYSLIHGVSESKNLGDITTVNEQSIALSVDLITYGFPCQDISIAGHQQGLFDAEGEKTRSGLFFDALRIIQHTQPKVAIAENVKNLTCKKFAKQFQIVLQALEDAGYNNYWSILNSKDYGVPQNRERVFIVSIRKEIDTRIFQFPEPFTLKKRLKDLLEPHVDEKYFLSNQMLKGFIEKSAGNGYINQDTQASKVIHQDGIFQTLCAGTHGYANGYVNTDRLIQVGQMYGTEKEPNPQAGRIYSAEGISPTMDSCSGGNRMPKVSCGDRIRRLTPLECFRLMAFDDSDCRVLVDNKIKNTQLYKMAGNSIVVDVVEELLCMMFDDEGEIYV